MRKNLITLLCLFMSISLYSQMLKNSSWAYRVQYVPTIEMSDSLNSFTKIFVEINQLPLADSSLLEFSIKDSSEVQELLNRQIIYTSAMLTDSVISIQDSILKVYLGKYVIAGSPLKVNMKVSSGHK